MDTHQDFVSCKVMEILFATILQDLRDGLQVQSVEVPSHIDLRCRMIGILFSTTI